MFSKSIKVSAIAFITLMATLSGCHTEKKQEPIHFLTYNIRFENPHDGVNAWLNRKDKVAALIGFYDVEIACRQEVLYSQLIDLEQRLPHMSWVGIGRDDGHREGEFVPILYNNQIFKLINSGWFWLSETPDSPSLGWDAACKRVVTWVHIKHLANERELFVFNTHFDHVGEVARIESSRLIMAKIQEIAHGYPTIIAGDFNGTPNDAHVKAMTQEYADSYLVSEQPPYGPIGTWNDFDYNSPLDERIDYLFVNESVRVLKYGVLTDSEDGRFPSDHLPVYAKILIE